MFDDAAIELGERFIECCREASDVFEKLLAYNTKEGPLFYAICGISSRFLSAANEDRSALADLLDIGRHIDNDLIMDINAIEYCRGAPPELLARARTSCRRFKKIVNAFK
jgi:hypothetical protein